MTGKKKSNWFYCFMPTAVLAMVLLACSGGSDKWMGTVDATFKYRPEDSTTSVFDVPRGTKSFTAGLIAGDMVLAVDGKDLAGASLGEVLVAMNGPVGSVAVLTVQRGAEVLDLEVERMHEKKKDKKPD
jgi:C-terminal processing protease CtpA/Prc